MNKFLPKAPERGFTLIELLIVMGIVSALAGFFITAYPASQKRARDTQRKSDLKQYQTALEVYANKNNGLYPRRPATQRADTTLCSDLGLTGNCPADPKDGENVCSGGLCRYFYQTESASCGGGQPCATRYVLWGRIENPSASSAPYYVVCSNGKSGEGATAPSGGNCPI